MKLPLAFTIWLALVTYGLSDIQVTPLSSPGIPPSHRSTICHITVCPIHSSAYRSNDLYHCGSGPTHSLWPNSGADFPVQTSRASPSRATQSRATLSRVSPSRVSPSRVTPFRATPSRLCPSRSSLSVINSSRATTSRLSALRVTPPQASFVRPQTTTQRTSQDVPETSITALYLSPTSTHSSSGSSYKSSSSAKMSLGRHGVVVVMTLVILTTLALVL